MKLRITNGKSESCVLLLQGDGPFTIGRHSRSDLRINDKNSSRFHSAITKDGDNWMITDLSSFNGTVVNGEKISSPTKIKVNDLIGIGNALLEVE